MSADSTFLQSTKTEFEIHLHKWAGSFQSGTPPFLYDAFAYSLLAPGKRLRPLLVLAAAHAVGQPSAGIWDVACAIEMVHAYSLVQDDLPCMDNDDLRRGQPSTHKKFGETVALLASDALFSSAIQCILDADFASETKIEILREIMEAIGMRGMLAGQVQDVAKTQQPASLQALIQMHRAKTGALIRAAVLCGARLASATPAQTTALAAYAEAIGLAFQVMDDVLDTASDSAQLGKTPGKDKQLEKFTFVDALGIAQAKEFAEKQIQSALLQITSFDHSADPLRQMANQMVFRSR